MWQWNGERLTHDQGSCCGCPRTPHLTYGGRCNRMRLWVSLRSKGASYRAGSVARDWLTGRPGSWPSPWHGKVVGSAMAGSTHVGTGLPACPWTLGTLQGHLSVCGVLRTAVHHTLDHSRAPDFGLISAKSKFATSERGVLGVWRHGTGSDSTRDGGLLVDAPGSPT